MLRWCAYCQQFLGEAPPFERLEITHGVCNTCAEQALDFTPQNIEHAQALHGILEQLSVAGSHADMQEATKTIRTAMAAHLQPVDILLGLVAPLLYEVGEEWRKGIITVATEHRFTEFFEQVYALLESRVRVRESAREGAADGLDALVMNAWGNRHTLAARVLSLWLRARGLRTQLLDPPPPPEDVAALIIRLQPRMVFVSVALSEHIESVRALTDMVSSIPESHRPRFVVGGSAVKMGLVPDTPGLELVPDIHDLNLEAAV